MEFCSKTSFSDQKTAQEHLVRIFFEKRRKSVSPNREYLCPNCNTWHLSSNGTIDYVYNLKIKELQDKIVELQSKKKVVKPNTTQVDELLNKNLKMSRRIEKLNEKIGTYKNIMQNLRDKQTIIDKFFALLSAEKDIEVLSGISKFAEQKINALKNG
jgi:uncharacterized Zn finger protein (UPF0148 family)